MSPMRILGVGKRAENASAMEELLRAAGYEARNFAITDDAEGDALLVAELRAGCDAVVIGSFINGQHAELPASPQTTAWFNRLINLIGEHALMHCGQFVAVRRKLGKPVAI